MHSAEIERIDQLSSQANRSKTIEVAVPALLEARQVVLDLLPTLYEDHPKIPKRETLILETGETWRTIARFVRAVGKTTGLRSTWERAAYEHAIATSYSKQSSTVATAKLELQLFNRSYKKSRYDVTQEESLSEVRSQWQQVWETSQHDPDRLMMTTTWFAATALREGNFSYGKEGIEQLIKATELYNESVETEEARTWARYFIGHTILQSLFSRARIQQYRQSLPKDAAPAHEFSITFPYRPDPYDRFKGLT